MPAMYEAMRDYLRRKGLSMKEAKRRAAMSYNAHRKPGQAPVTRNYEKTKAKQHGSSKA